MTIDQIQAYAETALAILGCVSVVASLLGTLPLGRFAAACKVVGVDVAAVVTAAGNLLKPKAGP
jgi:hypothetical protein